MARTKSATRSVSRGRPAKASPKKATPKKAAKTPAKTPAAKTPAAAPAAAEAKGKLDFSEGDKVMARWPGTSLYFKAKITYVRQDDGEYDVQYEDGTIFTIKAKEVRSPDSIAPRKATTPARGRSRSRGRSPSRKASTRNQTPTTKASPVKRASRSTTRAPRAEPAPVRSSARLANAKISLSSDEDDGPKAIPNPEHPRGKKGSWLPEVRKTKKIDPISAPICKREAKF